MRTLLKEYTCEKYRSCCEENVSEQEPVFEMVDKVESVSEKV